MEYNPQDVSIIEGMQGGRNSPAYNGGNFSPIMDNPTHHFHKMGLQQIYYEKISKLHKR